MGASTRSNGQTDSGLARYPMKVPGEVILEAVLGSHAYGLARPESDIDTQGIYVASALRLSGMKPPAETVTHTNPDFTFHELVKFCRLAQKCNPTVLEILWVTDYVRITDEGRMLVNNRSGFLSKDRILGAFGGYAMDQMKRIHRGQCPPQRREKHARHCFRLLEQGRQLLLTGDMTLKVDDPEKLFALGRLDNDAMYSEFEAADYELRVAYLASELPLRTDWFGVEVLVNNIRIEHLA